MTEHAYDHVVGVLDAAGLARTDKGAGRSAWQAPGHSPKDRSLIVTDGPTRVLFYSHSDPVEQVMDTLSLTFADLYDGPSVDYSYSDGRIKHRATATKDFTQSGNRKGPGVLYRLDRLRDATVVHWAEGEEDVHALESAGVVATCTASTSGRLPDLSVLHGKTIVVWRDKDDKGREYVAKIVEALDGKANVRVVEAKSGKDASDHLAAGHTVDAAVPVESFTGKDPGRQLRVVRGDEVRTRRVQWWETDLIPRASLTLLAGREGLGKSTVACSWAARETNTGNTILYLHSEDSREHTVAPRLKAAGADMTKVLFLDVHTEYSDTGTVILPLDTAAVEKVIVDHEVTFMVLDAATSSMSSELSGRDDREVRRFLEPLAQLAARRDLVVLGLVHFGKRDGNDTGKLILGSIAWSQVARSVLSLARDDDNGELILTNTKGNLAPRTRSVSLRIQSATVYTDDGDTEVGSVQWLGDTDRDARELLAGEDNDAHERDEIKTIIREFLIENGGQAKAAEVLKATRSAGLADAAVKKARRKAGVATRKIGVPGEAGYWVWTLEGATAEGSREDSEDSRSREKEPSAPSAESSAKGSTARASQSGQPTPYTGERGPTGPTGSDEAQQSGPTVAKTQLGHVPVHGPTGVPTEPAVSSADPSDRCPACNDVMPGHADGLFPTNAIGGLCPPCAAATGYIERTVTKLSAARLSDLQKACSSSDGSRHKLRHALVFAVMSGRIDTTSVDGKHIYTRPEQTSSVRTPGRRTGQWLGSGQHVERKPAS